MNRLLTNIITISMMLLSCYSCKNDTAKTKVQSTIQLDGLTLNNNEKWIANKETHIGMQRIDSILKSNISLDIKSLKEALSKQTSYIIKSCNMTGKSHDQLHIVLIPILNEITELKETKNTSKSEEKLTTLKRLTATYFNYFKI